MICITGAGGTVGREVFRKLESAKTPFRVAYFSNEKAEAARAKGIDAVIIDYNRPATLRLAFQECAKLFLLGPNAMNQSDLERNDVVPKNWTGFLSMNTLSERTTQDVEKKTHIQRGIQGNSSHGSVDGTRTG
jgi:nucleoside-diphosphate-sugar epimerase